MILILFQTHLSKTTLVYWAKNPSIVFDQGVSIIWGSERLLSGCIFEDDFISSSYKVTKSFTDYTDWESLYENNPVTNSSIHDPLSPIFEKDHQLKMSAPDRPRKLSISDIIDVLNLQEERSLLSSSNEDYDASHSDSASGSGRSSTWNDQSPLQTGVQNLSPQQLFFPDRIKQVSIVDSHDDGQSDLYADCRSFLANIKSDESSSSSENCYMSSNLIDKEDEKEEEDIKKDLKVEVVSDLLNTTDDAVILVMDKNKKISYVSTSRKKLEKYFDFSQTEKKKSEEMSSCSSSEPLTNQKKPTKRRGRKRIHQPDKTDDVRMDMRRQRNNEASKVVRHKRKQKQLDLFTKESALIQDNLNLKTQFELMTKQVNYMREKLGVMNSN